MRYTMAERPLTQKQAAFLAHYLESGNATAACRAAGYKGDDNVLAVTGSRMLRHPKISKLINESYEERGLSSAAILGRLAAIAESGTTTEKLRALEIMARHQISTKREVQHGTIVHDQRTLTKDEEGNIVEFEPRSAEG
jgi:phage terminase small subunit